MAKLGALLFTLPLVVYLLPAKSSQAYLDSSFIPKDWKASFQLGKQRFHDKVGDENATAVEVASDQPRPSRGPYLALLHCRRPAEGDRQSDVEGSGKSSGYYSRNREGSPIMALSFSFSTGRFKGSSLSMVSQNPITHTVWDFAIVSGTGRFQLARGVAVTRTIKLVGFNALVEYHVKVVHY